MIITEAPEKLTNYFVKKQWFFVTQSYIIQLIKDRR